VFDTGTGWISTKKSILISINPRILYIYVLGSHGWCWQNNSLLSSHNIHDHKFVPTFWKNELLLWSRCLNLVRLRNAEWNVGRQYIDNIGWLQAIFLYKGRKKNAGFIICLRFLSLELPQIKSLRSKTSYSRRSESFHSRRNCNYVTRSKCDANLWREVPDVCTARRTPSFRYNFP